MYQKDSPHFRYSVSNVTRTCCHTHTRSISVRPGEHTVEKNYSRGTNAAGLLAVRVPATRTNGLVVRNPIGNAVRLGVAVVARSGEMEVEVSGAAGVPDAPGEAGESSVPKMSSRRETGAVLGGRSVVAVDVSSTSLSK